MLVRLWSIYHKQFSTIEIKSRVCIYITTDSQNKQSLDPFQLSKVIWVPWFMVIFNKEKCGYVSSHSSRAYKPYLNSFFSHEEPQWHFYLLWRWLLRVGNISITALRHNPPLIIIMKKLTAGEALMWRTSPCLMKALWLWTMQPSIKIIYTQTRPSVAQEATRSFQWTERRVGHE